MSFAHIYFYIGLTLYLFFIMLIYMVGIDNIKNLTNEEDINDLDFNSPIVHLIIMFLLIVIWPVTIIWLIYEIKKQ